MAGYDKSQSPYFDDYYKADQKGESHKDKGYTHLLARPGRVAQAREFTQAQTVVKDIIKSLGDSFYKDGNIIEGCQVSTKKVPDTHQAYVTVSAGKVYINGMILPVAEKLDILIPDARGEHLVGLKLVEVTVSAEGVEGDPTLRDPAQQYDNSNQPGCDRVKSTVEITIDDPKSAELAKIIDGELAVEKYAPEYDTLTQTLARRTNDESGSYIVEGLKVRVEPAASDDECTVVVEAGKAYIQGYELRIPAPRRFTIPRATESDTVSRYRRTYDKNEDIYSLYGELPYVKKITEVSGLRVGVKLLDAPANNADIQDIYEGNISTILAVGSNDYVEGRHYELYKESGVNYIEWKTASYPPSYNILVGNSDSYEIKATISESGKKQRLPESITSIDNIIKVVDPPTYSNYDLEQLGNTGYIKWSGQGDVPTTQYNVIYLYTHNFEESKDFELHYNSSVRWLDYENSLRPAAGTTFFTTYEQYLARKDIVYMNQYGDISAVLGEATQTGFEEIPDTPFQTLALATIMNPPNGSADSIDSSTKILVSNIGLTRFTMKDIQKLLSRIETLSYDQSILALNDDARNHITTNEKRGIFTDPMVDFSKVDYYYNLANRLTREPSDEDKPIFDVTMDLVTNQCYLPVVSNTYGLKYLDSSSSKRHSTVATLNAKEEMREVLVQSKATGSFKINPYTRFPQYPEIHITPEADSWIDDTIIQIPILQSTGVVEYVEGETRHIEMNNTRGARRPDTVTTSYEYTPAGNRVVGEVIGNDTIISEKSVTYIRGRTIHVEGSQFPSGYPIACYFDGKRVNFKDTENGTVTADASGRFSANFSIEEGKFLTGLREVRVEVLHDGEIEGYEKSAIALYQASGVARTIQRTVTTLYNILQERTTIVTTIHNIDPVGQTFILDKMTLIKAIDLYFTAKPEATTPVTCEIREVVNGSITAAVYGRKTLQSSEVNIDSKASVATRFTFDDPILLEENKEYAFVVKSTSTLYEIGVAELGAADLSTGDTVLSNPYMIGVMMSSSNNSSWTIHQTTDVKFRLLAEEYENEAEIIFDNIVDVREFCRIYLIADSLIPEGTQISWSYSTKTDGTSYRPILPESLILLDKVSEGDSSMNKTSKNLSIKAKLSKNEESTLSPILYLDTLNTVLSSYDNSVGDSVSEECGYYVSNHIEGLDPYEKVDIVVDVNTPTGTAIDFYVDAGDGLLKPLHTTQEISPKPLGYGWEERIYTIDDVDNAEECRIFAKLSSNYLYRTPSFRRLRVIMA